MYSISDLKKDVVIQLDGVPYKVVDSQHVSLGRGGAVMRTKLKHMLNGSVLDRTFRAAEKIQAGDVTKVNMQYLYADGDAMVFMNQDTYDQITVPKVDLGDQAQFVAEESVVILLEFEGKVIGMEMPNAVYLKVTHTEPGARGNTATNALKPCTVETGVQVMVPLFINEGDEIKVDTRSGAYIERRK